MKLPGLENHKPIGGASSPKLTDPIAEREKAEGVEKTQNRSDCPPDQLCVIIFAIARPFQRDNSPPHAINERPTKDLLVHSFKPRRAWPGDGGQRQRPHKGSGDGPREREMVVLGAQFRLRLLEWNAIREDVMRGLNIERFLNLCIRRNGQVEEDGEGNEDCEQGIYFEAVRIDFPRTGIGMERRMDLFWKVLYLSSAASRRLAQQKAFMTAWDGGRGGNEKARRLTCSALQGISHLPGFSIQIIQISTSTFQHPQNSILNMLLFGLGKLFYGMLYLHL